MKRYINIGDKKSMQVPTVSAFIMEKIKLFYVLAPVAVFSANIVVNDRF